MDKNLWKQVERIVDVALTLDEPERSTFVEESCTGQEKLLQEVHRMLRSIQVSGEQQFLQDEGETGRLFMDEFHREFDNLQDNHLIGQEIGHWRITDRLGSGGMGTVFKARRIDGTFSQTVAVKLMRFGARSQEHLYRFKLEREILGTLHHPHIASIYDGGITDQGMPYLIMEYIDGKPIDVWCDHHRCSIEERIDLFKQVCQAVEYAHKNLVVHRDLKPGNIFVTEEGHVKILDFGIAKLLDPNLTPLSTKETGPGMRLMSLEYAAPEQVSGASVRTTTDIYSLGILLHQLLTGMLPFDFTNLSHREIEATILEETPSPASRRLNNIPVKKQQRIANLRSTDSSHLINTLKGDLDAIINKALRKDSERRFESVENLASDLDRHLNGQPILARPDTAGYRINKFVKRHRNGVLAAAVSVLVLIGIFAFYTVRVTAERNRAEQAAVQAQQEAQKAETVKEFLVSIFRTSDPDESRGATVTAREVLEEGTERIDNELSEQPEIQAEMMGVLGEVYQELGLFNEAEPLLEQALRLEQNRVLSDSSIIADDLTRLALLRYNQGNFDESVRLLRESLSFYSALSDPDPVALAVTQNHLGTLLLENGELAPADSLLRLALATRRTLDRPLDLSESLNTLALLLTDQGHYDEAEPLYQEALALQRDLLDADHPDLSETTYNLAQLYWNEGDLEAAEPLFREVLATSRRVYGNDHTDVALDLNMLGLVLMDQGSFGEAEAVYHEALSIQKNALGKEHPDYTATLYNLGSNYFLTEDYVQAEKLLREALVLDRRLFENDHPVPAIDMTRLAAVLHAKGNLSEADSLLNEALSIYRETYPEEHHRIVSVKIRMGQIAFNRGQYAEAEPMLRQVLTDTGQSFTNDWKTAETKSFLGRCLLAMGRKQEAEPLLIEALEILNEIFPSEHTMIRTTQKALERI